MEQCQRPPGPHRRPESGTTLLRRFSRFPGSVCLRLSAPGATQSRLPGALGLRRRSALGEPSKPRVRVGGIVGTSPRGERLRAEDTRPSAGGSRRVGARLAEANRRAATVSPRSWETASHYPPGTGGTWASMTSLILLQNGGPGFSGETATAPRGRKRCGSGVRWTWA